MEVSTLPRRGGGFLPHPRQVLKALGDDRLVEQIRRGNEAAFEVVYERHHRGILSFCRHMLSSQEEAEDAVQQTFVSAYYDLRSGDKEIRLKPWLYTIARNRCLSVLRARREQPAEIDDIPTAGLSEEVQHRDDLRRMLADMRGLPAEQRAALVLSELGDLSHADIGDVLGCPAVKVKSLVFQARSSLIESREAREIPCADIREQLATLRGGSLRRGPLRKHLNACPGCRDFREEVRRQRAAMAALLPVVPSAGLKAGIMGAIGGGGAAGGGAAGLGAATTAVAGGGAAAGGSAGIGGVIAMIAGGGTTKLAAAAVIATGAAGGTVAVVSGTGSSEKPAQQAQASPGTAQGKEARSANGITVNRSPGAQAAPGTKAKEKKKSKKDDAGAPTLVLNPDGTISVIPEGSAGSSTKGSKGNKGGNSANAPGRTRGNSNGENGTRTRAHGNPPSKGGRGNGNGPAPQAAPETAPPATAPPAGAADPKDKGDKADKGTRGGKGPKAPRLTLP